MTRAIGLLHPGEMGTTVGAAEVYRRMTGCKDAPNPPAVEEAAARVLAGTAPGKSSAAS